MNRDVDYIVPFVLLCELISDLFQLTGSVCDPSSFLALVRMSAISVGFSASQETISQCSEFDQIPASSYLPECHWSTNPYFVHSVMETLKQEDFVWLFVSKYLTHTSLHTSGILLQCSVWEVPCRLLSGVLANNNRIGFNNSCYVLVIQ